ncbi:transferase [Flavobacterium sp. MC2016-06]|jgi:acetyltransferase-like isoleucine patch superfamily enzyme|uniref:acyltransferase n=1 Tax=Flavobacterium sp. MC2016-06 TaxID=2676308 RepID=UPI00209B03C4|nr:transferase [Flavobacterium sp. MC2016-06]
MIRSSYRKCRSFYHKLQFYYTVNWIKTLYFNFKKFPFATAKKLPVFFYNKVKFTSIEGDIKIEGEIKKGMIGFGQPYEMNTRHKGIAEIIILGKITFKGKFQFGKDYLVFVGENASCELGNMASMASNGKLICTEKIVLGDYARLGSESQIIDTNFHDMIDTETGEKFKKSAPIFIGNYNFISNRVTIQKGTKTPDFCTIASNSLSTKDYTSLGNNILIGGIPASLIRNNISRDWQGEKKELDDFLTI